MSGPFRIPLLVLGGGSICLRGLLLALALMAFCNFTLKGSLLDAGWGMLCSFTPKDSLLDAGWRPQSWGPHHTEGDVGQFHPKGFLA